MSTWDIGAHSCYLNNVAAEQEKVNNSSQNKNNSDIWDYELYLQKPIAPQ